MNKFETKEIDIEKIRNFATDLTTNYLVFALKANGSNEGDFLARIGKGRIIVFGDEAKERIINWLEGGNSLFPCKNTLQAIDFNTGMWLDNRGAKEINSESLEGCIFDLKMLGYTKLEYLQI